jgi:Motility quorum-sensing regulator, toxin of MqsA
MAAKKPFFPLLDVKMIAHRQDGLHLSKTKAEASFSSFAQALDAARSMIESLTGRDFVETKQQRDPCDVYVVAIDKRGWYVKLTLLPEQVILISFHPLERPLRTARGHEVKT